MKIFVLLLLTAFSLSVGLQSARASALASVGSQLTFEYGNDGRNYEARQPFSLRAGYRFLVGDIYAEFSSFQESQGTSMVQVGREHQEYILWYRRMFRPDWKFSPYAAAGAGLQVEIVETNFSDASMKDSGSPQGLAAIAFGLRASVWRGLELLLEGRAEAASNFAPNPMLGAGAHIGWTF